RALGLDVAPGVGGVAVLAEVGNGDVGALAREQHRHRAADAGVAAGDQRHHAVELAAALVVGREEARLRIERVFLPGLALALLRQRVLRLPARPGLHRRLGLAGLFGGLLRSLLRGLLLRVPGIDVALDGALLRRRLLRLS